MCSITLIHPEETFTIPSLQVINKCNLFQKNPTLSVSPYRVHSPVSLSIFREFLSALEGNAINITHTNLRRLELLSGEFGFSEFSVKLSKFSESSKDSQNPQIGSSLTRMRTAFLRESFEFIVNGSKIERDFAESSALFPAVREQLAVDSCARKFFVTDSGIEGSDIDSLDFVLSGETISTGRSQLLLNKVLGNENLERLFLKCSKSDIRMDLSESVIDFKSSEVSNLSIEALDSLLFNEVVKVESEDSLLRFILKLGSDYRNLLRHIKISFLSDEGLSLLDEDFGHPPESVWESVVERFTESLFPLNSKIISNFPEIFAGFRKKKCSLLWRGSRDGFGAKEFHRRCGDHSNTLTVILDTKGNIFGGFISMKWDGSTRYKRKEDDNENCFLFTLKNPHNIPARKFELRSERKHEAIYQDSTRGPCFYGLGVCNDCNTHSRNYVRDWGYTYINNTQLKPELFFTGSNQFQVKEIEIFEITK
jgi:hypothetical protein